MNQEASNWWIPSLVNERMRKSEQQRRDHTCMYTDVSSSSSVMTMSADQNSKASSSGLLVTVWLLLTLDCGVKLRWK